MISITWAEVGAIVTAVSLITGAAATYVRLATVNAVREILNERLKDYMGRELVETRLQYLGTEMNSVRKDIDSLTHMVQKLKS
mgnify:FL=1|jgi:hypothetical protein